MACIRQDAVRCLLHVSARLERCHSERSEESQFIERQMLRFAQHDCMVWHVSVRRMRTERGSCCHGSIRNNRLPPLDRVKQIAHCSVLRRAASATPCPSLAAVRARPPRRPAWRNVVSGADIETRLNPAHLTGARHHCCGVALPRRGSGGLPRVGTAPVGVAAMSQPALLRCDRPLRLGRDYHHVIRGRLHRLVACCIKRWMRPSKAASA
jgi:hypothetical protein